jgi:hypothetical protein
MLLALRPEICELLTSMLLTATWRLEVADAAIRFQQRSFLCRIYQHFSVSEHAAEDSIQNLKKGK